MEQALRLIDRIQDQADFQGPLVDGQFVRWNSGSGKFALAAGGTGDLSYTFTQLTPATVWTIAHNLGKRPSVSVTDSGGTEVYGDVNYVDANNLTITFSAAFGGVAYLN
jgi:hypothetical protein